MITIHKSKVNIISNDLSSPYSKSYLHRYLFTSLITSNEVIINNVTYSNDVLESISVISLLGKEVITSDNKIVIINKISTLSNNFQVKESGCTFRFLLMYLLVNGIKSTITITSSLYSRVKEELKYFKNYLYVNDLDFIISTNGKVFEEYSLNIFTTSQYLSGLAIALGAHDKSFIKNVFNTVSYDYFLMTLKVLNDYGITSSFVNDGVMISRSVTCDNTSFKIYTEIDYSSMSYIYAIYMINDIELPYINSLQPDSKYISIHKQLKSSFQIIDVEKCIDLSPLLFVVASIYYGAKFINIHRLRFKESNRIEALLMEFDKCGITYTLYDNDIVIYKSKLISPLIPFESHNDHRIVMALSVLLTVVGGSINNPYVVNKSYPLFFNDLETLGIKIDKSSEE